MARFKAAVFDWAGTMIDFGSFAPVAAFVETFAEFGVEATVGEARAPMGLPKRDHIEAMLRTPRLSRQWAEARGGRPTRDDIDAVYEVFVPKSEEVVARHATLAPGAAAAVRELRARGMKIGSTTGYSRSIMERILPAAAAQGYAPDNLVCADDLAEGRPGPLAMYRCFVDLAVHPPEAVVKVDDTEPGIAEGVAAGCLAVGVALSGNHAARTPEDLAAMTEEEIAPLRDRAASRLGAAGARHVIDTVADLPALIARLEAAS